MLKHTRSLIAGYDHQQASVLQHLTQTQMVCRTDNKPTGSLDFELPYNSKLLLLAAYIASRNRPASDRKLFDNTAGKRRRKNALASDRQVDLRADRKIV